MKHTEEAITVTVDYGLAEYKQIVSDFAPIYLDAKHPHRNPYFPWNWAISEKAMFAVLVPLIFRWKKAKVGLCEFTFNKQGLTRVSKSGSAFRAWEEVSLVRHLSTAYLIELAAGGAMPVPYRVLDDGQRTLFESFASQVPNKAFNSDADKNGAG